MGAGPSTVGGPVPQYILDQQAAYRAVSQPRYSTPPPATNVYTLPKLATPQAPFSQQPVRQLSPTLTLTQGTSLAPAAAPSQAVGAVARPVQAPVFRPIQQSSTGATAATAPITMAQLTQQNPQKFLGGYFTGGPDDSDMCSSGIIFLLLLVILVSVAIVLSSYSTSGENVITREKLQGIQ